jgi:signal transduction histidine kinase
MIHSSDRQLNLLNSLLEAHSNEMRGILLCCEPVQLNPMIQDLTADLEPLFTKNQVKLINLIPLIYRVLMAILYSSGEFLRIYLPMP